MIGAFAAQIAERKRREREAARRRAEAARRFGMMKRAQHMAKRGWTKTKLSYRQIGKAYQRSLNAFTEKLTTSGVSAREAAKQRKAALQNGKIPSAAAVISNYKAQAARIRAAANEIEDEKKIGYQDLDLPKDDFGDSTHSEQWYPIEGTILQAGPGNIQTEGTFLLHNQVLLAGRDLWLATRTEEGYAYGGISPEDYLSVMSTGAKAITYIANGVSFLSDFYVGDLPLYSINAEVNWTQYERGVEITDVNVLNYAPTFVEFVGVQIESGGHVTRHYGTGDLFGTNGDYPGIDTINVDRFINTNSETTLTLAIKAAGAYPSADMASMEMFIDPSGTLYPGCSAPVLVP